MKRILVINLIFLLMVATASVAEQAPWRGFNWKKFGVRMEAPVGSAFVMRQREKGWGELHGAAGEAHFVMLCRLGKFVTAEEIETYAVKEFEIDKVNWELFDEGKDTKGWNWYKSWIAKSGTKAFMAAYGVGKKGSYLIYVRTRTDDLENYKLDYRRWYDSITLIDN